MTEIEHRATYAAQQREQHANDAAGWYAVAQGLQEQLREQQETIASLLSNAADAEKQRIRIMELEATIERLSAPKRGKQ